MDQKTKQLDDEKDMHVIPPEAAFNGNYTAIPKDISDDDALETKQIEYGKMNEKDARESGYIKEH